MFFSKKAAINATTEPIIGKLKAERLLGDGAGGVRRSRQGKADRGWFKQLDMAPVTNNMALGVCVFAPRPRTEV